MHIHSFYDALINMESHPIVALVPAVSDFHFPDAVSSTGNQESCTAVIMVLLIVMRFSCSNCNPLRNADTFIF
jgi:hypothetical protein